MPASTVGGEVGESVDAIPVELDALPVTLDRLDRFENLVVHVAAGRP